MGETVAYTVLALGVAWSRGWKIVGCFDEGIARESQESEKKAHMMLKKYIFFMMASFTFRAMSVMIDHIGNKRACNGNHIMRINNA